ncbi:hypothetical protein [Nocardia sp. NPDC004604]|uniref:hypothetical protein n=1 Tax=Nocardia sp. NPDC004604 TaxID=3157013 RepID=UPI0033B099E5
MTDTTITPQSDARSAVPSWPQVALYLGLTALAFGFILAHGNRSSDRAASIAIGVIIAIGIVVFRPSKRTLLRARKTLADKLDPGKPSPTPTACTIA